MADRSLLHSFVLILAVLAPTAAAAIQDKAPVARSEGGLAQEAESQLDKAREVARTGKYDEAIAGLEAIASKYGTSKDPAVATIVARAIYGKGSVQRQRGDNDKAATSFDEVIQRFGQTSALEQRRWVIWSLIQKGELLTELSRSSDALATYDQAISRAGNEPGLAKEAAVARYDKGLDLARQGQNDRAIATFDEITSRYGDTANPQLQEAVVLALDAKAIALEQAGKNAESIAACDSAVARYGGSTDASVRAAIARTLVDKGITLRDSGDPQASLRVNEEVLHRFGDSKDAEFQQWIATAYLNRGVALAALARLSEARASFDEVVRRFDPASDPQLKELVANARAALLQVDRATGSSGGANSPQPGGRVPTLEMAMAAPAADLARGYMIATWGVRLIQLAQAGETIVTPEGTINKDTASQWQKIYAGRQAIYQQAILKRGVANFAGTYSLSSINPSCAKSASSFAAMIADKNHSRGPMTITQNGFELRLTWANVELIGAREAWAAENSFAFNDPLNSDYTHIGQLTADTLVIRPQADVLSSWPAFVRAPKEGDIRSCAVVLVRGK